MVKCPGCQLSLPNLQLPEAPRYNASGECWQLYHELSFYTLALGDLEFLHQLAVDAYGAQHVGGKTKPITVVFALIGLCLAIEHRYAGRQVQQAHMNLARQTKDWPVLVAKPTLAALTISDVLQAQEGAARNRKLKDWAGAVWESWQPAHELSRQLISRFLAVE